MGNHDEDRDHADTKLLGELLELGNAIKPLFRRFPGVKKAIDLLTGGLAGTGAEALASRLRLYRTGNLVKEAKQVADATGLPVPLVFNNLVHQRRIDELTVDALQRVGECVNGQNADRAESADAGKLNTADRWFHALYEEAGRVDEEDVREGFVRILAGELRSPGSFSLRTLRVMGAVSPMTATRFRRAASVSIRLTPDNKHIFDARIPAAGGQLGQNALKSDGLSYNVLLDLTENGLVHPDYNCYHEYVPIELPFDPTKAKRPISSIRIVHQNSMWDLIPKEEKGPEPLRVTGAKLTTCGVELLRIVDVEPLPSFTMKLEAHFSQSGHRMVKIT